MPETSPDDLYLVCTGGTTGRPKAVLWRQADIYVSAMAGVEDATAESIVEAATTGTGSGRPWYPVAPLMHAAAQWTAFSGLNQGATVVVHEDSAPFDARTVLELAEREQVALMSIVGDAYAVPWSTSCAAARTTCRLSSFWGRAAPPPGNSTRRHCSTFCPTS